MSAAAFVPDKMCSPESESASLPTSAKRFSHAKPCHPQSCCWKCRQVAITPDAQLRAFDSPLHPGAADLQEPGLRRYSSVAFLKKIEGLTPDLPSKDLVDAAGLQILGPFSQNGCEGDLPLHSTSFGLATLDLRWCAPGDRQALGSSALAVLQRQPASERTHIQMQYL